jgi:hypothetical protein
MVRSFSRAAMSDKAPSELLSRRHQMFPRLSDAENSRVQRFGGVRHYRRGECGAGASSTR